MTTGTAGAATTGARVFVSHSHEDEAFCLRLLADLRARLGDAAVWYDQSGGLHGSEDWWDRIVAEITERPYFLVVLSPAASVSKWVPQEMKIAFRQSVELGKRLLPVRLADAPRRPDWEGIQEFDFRQHAQPERYAAALAELLRQLGVNPDAAPVDAGPIGPGAGGETPRPPVGATSTSERPLSELERLARETHTAFGREHWSDVLDKTELLVERGAMTPLLWRERVSAALALGETQVGLAAIEQAMRNDPDDVETLVLLARHYAHANNDAQAIVAFTRAYVLAPLEDTALRLRILSDLCAALERAEQWDVLLRRATDGRRLEPQAPRWTQTQAQALLRLGRVPEAIVAMQELQRRSAYGSAFITPLLPAAHAAIAAAVQREDWATRRALLAALLDLAATSGADPATITRWRRLDFPRFLPALTLTGHMSYVLSVAWAPDGARLATASVDQTARVWEAASGRLLATLTGHTNYLHSVAWTPDGTRLATASGDNTARVWGEE